MYNNSLGNQAYTIAVWLLVDWLSRVPPIVHEQKKNTPIHWTVEQWRSAASFEEMLRELLPDDPELIVEKQSIPAEIQSYVREHNEDRCDDGVLRRFPDQLLVFIIRGTGDVALDASGAMRDALILYRNVHSRSGQ